MDILLKDISIQDTDNNRDMLIKAKHTEINYLYVRYSTPDSHNETATWHIDKENLNDGLFMPKRFSIVYLVALYDNDDGVIARSSGIYRLVYSNGEELLIGLRNNDIIPVKLADGVTLVSHDLMQDISQSTVTRYLLTPVDLSSTYAAVKLPRTIEEVKGLQQRNIQLRDPLLAHNCFQLNVKEPVEDEHTQEGEDDIPDFDVTISNREGITLQERMVQPRVAITNRPLYRITDNVTWHM